MSSLHMHISAGDMEWLYVRRITVLAHFCACPFLCMEVHTLVGQVLTESHCHTFAHRPVATSDVGAE